MQRTTALDAHRQRKQRRTSSPSTPPMRQETPRPPPTCTPGQGARRWVTSSGHRLLKLVALRSRRTATGRRRPAHRPGRAASDPVLLDVLKRYPVALDGSSRVARLMKELDTALNCM